ncbi:MAG: ABC transporter substrate-binding protein [Candidatus Latescibacterota bacterium]|nr:MAG: ABC transporter substrate-binding protein [Candidatus Latescibacterota bacterium]
MKRSIALLAFVAFLTGCSKSPLEGDVLYLALETSPNKLDPALVIDVAEGQICSLIYQGLVRFSPEGDVVPAAATNWEIEANGTRYIFHLDPRARFSNGTRLLAKDVKASFERVLSPTSNSPRKWVLDRIAGAAEFSRGTSESIAGLSSPDDSTIVIELREPFGPFLQLLAMPAAAIVPTGGGGAPSAAPPVSATAADDSGGELASRPVGSGKWKLDRWERGDFLELSPNPYHPGEPPRIKRIRYRIIPEAFTRIAEFEAGTLDILKIPQAELDRFLGDASRRDRIQSRPELRVAYIGLNNTRGPLKNPAVRRALNLAVDVDRIVDVLTGGHAVRATGAIPPGLPGYVKREPYAYAPTEAGRLLRAAGYGDGFEIDIWQRDSPEGNRVVEAVQGYLLELGVRVRVVKREWSAFKEAVSRGRVDAFFLDWYADYPNGENFLYPLFHSENAGGGGNRSFFHNTRVDSLIESAQRTVDRSTCTELYETIDGLVYDQAPWIYLFFPTSFVVVSPRVQGYTYPVLYLGEDFSQIILSAEGNS